MSGAAVSAEFHVVFAREFHVGAGHGGEGGVDSALFTESRAGREEPAIRYGHGVLRQAVYDLLAAGPEQLRTCRASGAATPEFCAADTPACPVCRIFGSPARPSPWTFSTLRPVAAAASAVRAGARTVSRAAIDPRTRRAGDGTLFAEELGAPRTFSLRAERADGGTAAGDELALLAAAARTVRGLGADRRRGRGECRIDLADSGEQGMDAGALLKRFGEAWLGETLPSASEAPRVARLGGTPSPALWREAAEPAAWAVFRLVLRLDEPLIAGSLPLTGNLLQGEPFVPGTLLLGALAGRALAAGPAEEAFLRAFRAGAVHFPDLHPLVPHEGRLHPVLSAPRDLVTCERSPGPHAHGVWSRLLSPEIRQCPACALEEVDTFKLPRLAGLLIGGLADSWRSDFSTAEETKIQVDAATGRVRQGSLYHREVLPAGTLLSGTLRVRSDALADLGGWGLGADGSMSLRLGKRHGRGYGAATLAWSAGDMEAEGTTTRKRIEAMAVPGAAIPLVATSRVLLRDVFGRTRQSLAPADLGLPEAMDGGCAVATRPVGGFWRHIGLPRRQETALEPGSVLVLRVPASLDEAARRALVDRLVALASEVPVGERAAEGFGRFAVAPFPYGWLEDEEAASAFAADDPRFQARPVPDAVRVRSPGVVRGLRVDPRVAERERFAERVAGLELGDDRWRAVARFLYARAGVPRDDLIAAIETGAGEPRDALDRAGADRAGRHFLEGDRAARKDPWWTIAVLVGEAAAGGDEALRAMRTRALADAMAQSITPGKGLA